MDPISSKTALAAAGAAGGKKLYVDDVFSTYLYDGNNTTGRDISNGIDLSGEGGLVWVKKRDTAENHVLIDTERGANNFLMSDSTNTANTSGGPVTGFNSDGFEVDNNGYVNGSNSEYVSWTFRKAPGYFDCVTYDGNGTSQNISHNLGSVPGAIFIKCTTSARDWVVYHRSTGATKYLKLNSTDAASTNSFYFDDTTPTASSFRVADAFDVNQSGQTYVAYIFAHDDQSFGKAGDEAIIKCGSYTGDGVNGGQFVDLGFEPQWVMLKAVSSTTDNNWQLYDVMRGINGYQPGGSGTVNSAGLYANTVSDDSNDYQFGVTPRGFIAIDSHNNNNNIEYIYVAIRRPHKQPSAGTDVFAVESLGATSPSPPGWTSGFPVDWAFKKTKNTNSNWEAVTRATSSLLYLNLTSQESSIVGTNDELDLQDGWFHLSTVNAENYSWMFKRAPGFFDVAAWTGDGVAGRTINHNLTVAPEFMIVKRRSGSENWHVYHKQPGATDSGFLNAGAFGSSGVWNDTEPTATTIAFSGDAAVNGSGEKYVGYFFATLPGISKVGHYTGTGAALNVDCGFTNGARFVLTKRIDAAGDWTLFDTARGIVAGNESRLSPNQSSAENNSDSIDPYSQGFALTTDQGDTNVSGGTYLFLAIA